MHKHNQVVIVLVLSVVGCVLAACSSNSIKFGKPIPGLPSFYTTAYSYPTSPGTLLKYQKLSQKVDGATVYRVMYVSRTELGAPSYVTGLVYVPDKPAGPNGYNVISWAHGTNGMAPICAPSLSPQGAVPSLNQLLNAGYVVVASDYQGEGTPGLLPYLAGKVAAQNTIDIVRAAHHIPGLQLTKSYLVWGHSEGGQTALFVWHIAKQYAPELNLVGVVAGAPPSQLQLIYSFLSGRNSPFKYYVLMVALGWNTAYGNKLAPLNQVFKPLAYQVTKNYGHQCAIKDALDAIHYKLSQLTKTDPNELPTWHKLIVANDPESFTQPTHIPLLIIHGSKDEQIPVLTSQLLAQHLCSIGAQLQRWLYPGQNHESVIPVSTNDMLHWINDRFEDKPFPDLTFKPTGATAGEPPPLDQDCKTGFTS